MKVFISGEIFTLIISSRERDINSHPQSFRSYEFCQGCFNENVILNFALSVSVKMITFKMFIPSTCLKSVSDVISLNDYHEF